MKGHRKNKRPTSNVQNQQPDDDNNYDNAYDEEHQDSDEDTDTDSDNDDVDSDENEMPIQSERPKNIRSIYFWMLIFAAF